MKKIGFVGLFFLTLLIFAIAAVSKSEGAPVTTTTTVGTVQLIGMIRPTLETYAASHPNMVVRVWSMVVLTNMDKLSAEQLSSIVPLIRQLGSNDSNIRQVALGALRQVLDLDQTQWKAIAATIFRNIAKTTKYPETKKLAIKSIAAVQSISSTKSDSTTTTTTSDSTTETAELIDSLLVLFDLAEDEDPDIRKIATETIQETLDSLKPKSSVSTDVSGGSD